MKSIQNRIYLVSWLPGTGKSIFIRFLCNFYPIIYSNLEMKTNGIKINNTILNIDDIIFVPYDDEKGIVVMEESGINVSSRLSLTEENREISKLCMLSRKKNKDLIFATQLKRNVDINIREMSIYKFEMNSHFDDEKERLVFDVTIENQYDQILWNKELDLIYWCDKYNCTYNTLEDSILVKDTKTKKRFDTMSLLGNLETL